MFHDRAQAGRVLGRLLATSLTGDPSIVLALPRGGVPVGLEVARSVDAEAFDVCLVRKLGVPGEEELAFGAIASGGVRVLNQTVIAQANLSTEAIDGVAQMEQLELDRRELAFRERRPPLELHDRTVLLVDDGLATGATMLAAVQAVRLQCPKRVVVAAPVTSREARRQLRAVADDIICAQVPHPFYAVGSWYCDFEQVSDDEVRHLLSRFTPASSTLRSALRTSD